MLIVKEEAKHNLQTWKAVEQVINVLIVRINHRLKQLVQCGTRFVACRISFECNPLDISCQLGSGSVLRRRVENISVIDNNNNRSPTRNGSIECVRVE